MEGGFHLNSNYDNKGASPQEEFDDSPLHSHAVCYLGEGRPLMRDEEEIATKLIEVARRDGYQINEGIDDLRVFFEENWYSQGRLRLFRFTREPVRCGNIARILLEDKLEAIMCCAATGRIIYIETF